MSQPAFGKRGRPSTAPAAPAETRSAVYLELVAAARAGATAAHDDAPLARRANGAESDMSLYIGPNWRSYRRLWADLEGAPRLRGNRCWSAGAFTSAWLLYRKQYLVGGALLAAQLGALYLDSWLSTGLDLLTVFFIGRYGKSIVLINGYHAIAEIRSLGLAPDVAERRIRESGGVNGLAFAVALGLVAFMMVRQAQDFGAPGASLDQFGILQDILSRAQP